MSGGSMNYLFESVERCERQLVECTFECHTPERIAFRAYLHKVAEQLDLVAQGLKAIEWEDSGDSSSERTAGTLARCLSLAANDSSPLGPAE